MNDFNLQTLLFKGVLISNAVWFMGLVKYDIFDNLDEENQPAVDLGKVSDALRYIFTWIPIMPQARALMALIQVKDSCCYHFHSSSPILNYITGSRGKPPMYQQHSPGHPVISVLILHGRPEPDRPGKLL